MQEHVRIAKGLIRLAGKERPVEAWGAYSHGMITISDQASRGTVYHEAFHAVVDTLLSDAEKRKMFEEGARRHGVEL